MGLHFFLFDMAASTNTSHDFVGFNESYAEECGSWYVLRATYMRTDKAKAEIGLLAEKYGLALDCFVPKIKTYQRIDGEVKRVEKLCMNNIFFCFGNSDDVRAITKGGFAALPYVSYYYDHFSPNEAKPLTVSNRDLWNFRQVLNADSDQQLIIRQEEVVHFKSDDLVEITDGPFKGVTGRVARVLGQQRVVVRLIDTLAATSYIPTPLLRKLDE